MKKQTKAWFCSFFRAKVPSTKSKVVQIERNTKGKLVFLCISEMQLITRFHSLTKVKIEKFRGNCLEGIEELRNFAATIEKYYHKKTKKSGKMRIFIMSLVSCRTVLLRS